MSDRRDHPVPEARVLALPLAGDGGAPKIDAPFETTSDLDGHFLFANLPPGPYRLLIEAAGFPTAEVARVLAPTLDVVVRVDGEGRAIVGHVRAGGAAVPGARVLLAPDGGGPLRETTTRPGGGFAFGGLGAGLYALRAVSADAASAPRRAVEAQDRPSPEAPVVLDLVAATAVAGRVIDDAGTALADVPVRIETDSGAPGEDPLPTLVRSDGGGAFAARVFPGGYRLSASRPGHVLRRAPAVDASGKVPATVTVLELIRGARLYGRVVDPRGAAAAGARVRCVASAIEDLTVQTGPLPPAAEAAALPSGAGRALGTTRATVADREGRFAVDDLIPGRYRIEVALDGAGTEPLRTDELLLAPGERRDAGKLALRPGFPVTGRVVDEGGVPIDGARVVVAAAGASAASAGLYTLSDAGGNFALALPVGSYRLAASASGRGTAQVAVDVKGGASPPALAIRLARAEATLEGLVRDDGGRPLARARLAVWPLDAFDGAAAVPPGATPIASGVADVGGHFAIAQLPAGDARLEVQHPDYPRSVHQVTPGRFANLTVPFPGGIAGEVKAKTTGAAVARGRLEATGPAGARASADVRKDGTFRLLRLAPGHWRLTVVATGYRNAERELDVPPSSTLGEASIRDLRVELDGT